MNKQGKSYLIAGIMICLLVGALTLYFVQAKEINSARVDKQLENYGIAGMKISDLELNGLKIAEKNHIGHNYELRNVFIEKRKGVVEQDIYLENKEGVNKTYEFVTIIEIDYSEIRWNGTRYNLTSVPIILTQTLYPDTGEYVTPNIFMDDKYNKRINYKDLAEKGGYALAYENGGKYYIELRIDNLFVKAGETKYIDPTYTNATDGFAMNASNGLGRSLAFDTSDDTIYVLDDEDDMLYHYALDGTYDASGSCVLGVGPDQPRGLDMNTTCFFVLDDADDKIYVVNKTCGALFDFSTATAGADSPRDVAYDSTDNTVWVTDNIDDWIYHLQLDGTNITDGFNISVAGADAPTGIAMNNSDSSYWIVDDVDDWVYHFNSTGDNQSTDGFDLAGPGSTTNWGVATNGSDLWLTDTVDNFVYHFIPDVPAGDTTDPVIKWKTPTNSTYTANSITFNVTATDNVGMSTCFYSLTGGTLNYTMTNTTASSFNATNSSMTQGSHTVNYYCNDTSDNWGTNSTMFFIDSINPQISIASPSNDSVTTNSSISVKYTYTEANPDTCWWQDGTGSNTTLASCGTNITMASGSYSNQSDGFSASTNGGTSYARGITTNGTDIWLVDEYHVGDFAEFIYHFDMNGNNQTDGFDPYTSDNGKQFWGVTFDTSDNSFWTCEYVGNMVYHYNSTGDNQPSEGFSISTAGITNARGIAFDDSDNSLWITDNLDDFLYHLNSTGVNQSDGFSLTAAGIDAPNGVAFDTTDDSFWVVDDTDNFAYHLNSAGVNQSDGFSLNSFGMSGDSVWGIAFDTTDNSFWITSVTDNFVYHIADVGTWAEGNHNVTIFINDTSGNQNQTSVSFAIDSISPTFVNWANQSIYSNQNLYFDVNATDTNLGNFSINWTTTFSIVASTGVLTNTSSLSIAEYYINVSINDTAGNLASDILLVNVSSAGDVTYPQITIVSPSNDTFSTNNTFSVKYTYVEANPDACWWQDGTGSNTTLASCGTNITLAGGGYNNLSDGFKLQSNTIRGVTFDTSDNTIWASDSCYLGSCGENWVYHYSLAGTNLSDGFTIGNEFSGTDGGMGIAYDNTDDTLWIFKWTTDDMYHYNASTGANIADGFDIGASGISVPRGMAFDTTDNSFWITDNTDDFLYHLNSAGVNQSDGFSLSVAGCDAPNGVEFDTTDNSFWVLDDVDDFLYHFNSAGTNQSDGFSVTSFGLNLDSIWGVTIETADNSFWISDATDDWLYHISGGVGTWAEGNHNVTIFINDTSGNQNQTYVSFGVDTIAPTFVNWADQSIYNNQSLYFDVNATDATAGLGNFSINWTTTFSIVASTGVLTNISSLSALEYYINVSVNDTIGNLVSDILLVNVSSTPDTTPPSVTIDSPLNQSYYTNTTNFSLSVTDGTCVDSCWFTLNSGITNYSMTNVTASVFNYTNTSMNVATYTAKFYCNDTSNNINNTEQVTFTITTMYASIDLTHPSNGTTIILLSQNFTANYTAHISNLTNVSYYIWYVSNGSIFNQTNYTITGITNTTNLSITNLVVDDFKWNVFVCVESGSSAECNWDDNNLTFTVGATVTDEIWDNHTFETASEYFQINLSLASGTSLVSANLSYNGTNYPVSDITIDNSNYILRKTIDVPLNPSYFGNASYYFNWSFIYVDAYDVQTHQTTTLRQQNATYIVINVCNATYTKANSSALNFTMYDEMTGNQINATINNTDFEVTFDYWLGSGSVIKNYSYQNLTNNETSSFAFCIHPWNETLNADMDMQYDAVDYSSRTYYLRNASLDNETNNIRLELLDDSEAVKFFIEVREGMLGFPGATVSISKYFTGEGGYRAVSIRETDINGEFIEYLELDQTYQFAIVKEGVSYGTITEQATCTASPCEMTLQIEEATVDMWQGYYDEFATNVAYTLEYNDTTKMVTYIFNDLTGLAQSFALDVANTKYNESGIIVFEPDGTYCNKTLAAVAGTLSCNMTNYTKGDFLATGYISRSPPKIVETIKFVISSIKDVLGQLGIFASFLIIVVVGLVGVWNPAVGVILTAFAILMMKILGFVAFSYTTVILIIIMAVILASKMKS